MIVLDSVRYDYSPRAYHLTSVSGVFEAHELLNPARHTQHASPFTALQADLLKVPQPGEAYIFDNVNHSTNSYW